MYTREGGGGNPFLGAAEAAPKKDWSRRPTADFWEQATERKRRRLFPKIWGHAQKNPQPKNDWGNL